jgi:hypothetical protein
MAKGLSDGLVLFMGQRCDGCGNSWLSVWIGLSQALNLMSEGLFKLYLLNTFLAPLISRFQVLLPHSSVTKLHPQSKNEHEMLIMTNSPRTITKQACINSTVLVLTSV